MGYGVRLAGPGSFANGSGFELGLQLGLQLGLVLNCIAAFEGEIRG